MPGYAPTLPKIMETIPFHKEKISFQLEKTPQTIEKEYLAKGYIRKDGNWIDPKQYGLVAYKGEWMTPEEKTAAINTDKGLVLYKETWITPAEKEVAYARDQKEKGFVLFKGNWYTPTDKALQEETEERVDQSFSSEYRTPPPPTVVGTIASNQTRIRVLNGIGEKIVFHFSGPRNYRIALEAYESQNIEILPGSYRIASLAVAPGHTPACWTWKFNAGFRYAIVEEGEPLELRVKPQKSLTPEQIKKQYGIPDLKIPDSPTSKTKEKELSNKEKVVKIIP